MLDDLETRATAEDHEDLRLWLRLMTVHRLIGNAVRRRLRAEIDMSLARFDLMAQLERNPAGIRMGELSKRLMVTTGNITQLADPLETEGLVERVAEPDNRRACRIRLTVKGRKRFDIVARAHEAWIAGLFSGLSRQDKRQLFAALAKHKAFLAAHIDGLV